MFNTYRFVFKVVHKANFAIRVSIFFKVYAPKFIEGLDLPELGSWVVVM